MTTDGETAHRTPHNGAVPGIGANTSMGAPAPARVTDRTALTDSDVPWWRRQLDDLTPPTVWADQPPSLRELSLYASHGAWTTPEGFWRTGGVWWCRLIAIPVSTTAYYLAWLAQRPARTAVFALLYAVIAHTGPGNWLLWWPTWLP